MSLFYDHKKLIHRKIIFTISNFSNNIDRVVLGRAILPLAAGKP